MKKRLLSIVALILLVMSTACGNDERVEQIESLSNKYAVSKENQLIVYTSHKEEVYLPIIREFESRTGIWVDVHAGGTAEMMQAAKDASKNGQCDIMFGGGVESYEASKEYFLSYQTAEDESLDDNFVDKEYYWTPFTELPLVFVYNRNLVTPSSAPKGWKDLFQENWKGKIAFADMEKSGTSYTIISTMAQLFNEEPEVVLDRFYQQLDGNILSSSGDVVSEVSNGNYLVGITLEETAIKAIDAGSNIVMAFPNDGTSAVPDGIAMLKNAPHSFNAGKFIDFVVGHDTQSYAMTEFNRRSVRLDVKPTSKFIDFTLIDFDISKAAKDEKKLLDEWRSLMEGDDE